MESWPAFEGGGGSFSFVINTSLGGILWYSFDLTIDSNSQVIIFWGDGSQTQAVSGSNQHYYSQSGIYLIFVVGLVAGVSFSASPAAAKCLVLVNSPISADPDAAQKRIYMANMFAGCSNLEKIPDKLLHSFFANNYIIYSLESVFDGCSSLKLVPGDLFDGAILIDPDPEYTHPTISRMFYGCTALKTVPQSLFSNPQFRKIQVAEEVFRNSGLTDVPDYFFSELSMCRRFARVFFGCSSLQSIGDGVFSGCDNGRSFLYAFGNCYILSDIGADVFNQVPSPSSFNGAFSNCYSLVKIPTDLFRTDWNVSTNFERCFYNDGSIDSDVPELWEYYDIGTECYSGCTAAHNWPDIPRAWGGPAQ